MKTEKGPFELARERFEAPLGDDAILNMTHLQQQLAQWRHANIPSSRIPNHLENVLGVGEEMGELAEAANAILTIIPNMVAAKGKIDHATLKTEQNIRGYSHDNIERLREECADALADIMVFVIQDCTSLRLDVGTLLLETCNKIVLKRNFKQHEHGTLEGKPNAAESENKC